MALDKFPDVYDWICHLQRTFKDVESAESLQLTRMDGKVTSVDAHNNGNGEISLCLSWNYGCVAELGACRIGNCSEEGMQDNLFPLFVKLCIYAFLKVARTDIVELQRLDMGSDTIESETYKQGFNSVFAAASYSLLLHIESQFSIEVVSELRKSAEKTRKETLAIIGPYATDRLMKSLAAKFTEIRLQYGTASINPFEMSYSSRLDGNCIVNTYCPRLSMQLQTHSNKDMERHADLELALSHQLVHCEIQFRYAVTVYTDWIDVEFQIDNLRCQEFQLKSSKPIPSKLEQEWYFPAKITLTMSPEYESGVQEVVLGASSRNRDVTVSTERIYEAEQAATELKVRQKHSYAHRLSNWWFDLSVVDDTEGRFEWTLRDNSYGIPVFNYTPPKFNLWNANTWSAGDSYKAFRAFARGQGEGSVKPFTAQGGVVFAADLYGTPITWRFHRDLMEERQTMKWIVEGQIWMAYYPNKYITNRYMEIRYHKFCEQVEFPLENRNRSQ